ncbi:hypothetical protein B7494_g6015 [Chlorociboria aeruginascens]|nr:hypothetical protein B7494_g6015 [Chlorociboria aeruginascens]
MPIPRVPGYASPISSTGLIIEPSKLNPILKYLCDDTDLFEEMSPHAIFSLHQQVKGEGTEVDDHHLLRFLLDIIASEGPRDNWFRSFIVKGGSFVLLIVDEALNESRPVNPSHPDQRHLYLVPEDENGATTITSKPNTDDPGNEEKPGARHGHG